MPFIDKLKAKLTTKEPHIHKSSTPHQPSAKEQGNDVPTFHTQPHPAKTNEPPQLGGGLNTNTEWQAHQVPGPFIPDQQMANSLEQPLSHEELQKRATELNK